MKKIILILIVLIAINNVNAARQFSLINTLGEPYFVQDSVSIPLFSNADTYDKFAESYKVLSHTFANTKKALEIDGFILEISESLIIISFLDGSERIIISRDMKSNKIGFFEFAKKETYQNMLNIANLAWDNGNNFVNANWEDSEKQLTFLSMASTLDIEFTVSDNQAEHKTMNDNLEKKLFGE